MYGAFKGLMNQAPRAGKKGSFWGSGQMPVPVVSIKLSASEIISVEKGEDMSLQEALQEFKEGVEAQLDPEDVAKMEEATEELIRSGIAEGAKKPGDRAPDFTLPDPNDEQVVPVPSPGPGSGSGHLLSGHLVTVL